MNDPVVDEVRRIRDDHAASFDYDLQAIFLDIKRRERERGLVFVDGVARQPSLDQTTWPAGAAVSDSNGSERQVFAVAAEGECP
jgi:hypothetical protein